MLTRKHFLDAAQYLEDNGKIEETFYDFDGSTKCACTVGALAIVDGVKPETDINNIVVWANNHEDDPLLEQFAYDISGEAFALNIYVWSDNNDTATVVAALREFGNATN